MMKKFFTYFLAWLIITWTVSFPLQMHAEGAPFRAKQDGAKIAPTEEQRETLRSTLLRFNETILSRLLDTEERVEKNSSLSSKKRDEILLDLRARIDAIKIEKQAIENAATFIELREIGKKHRENGLKDSIFIKKTAYLGLDSRISQNIAQLKQGIEKMKKIIEVFKKAGGKIESLENMIQELDKTIIQIELKSKESKDIFAKGDIQKAFELSKEVSGSLQTSFTDLKTIFSLLRENISLLRQKNQQ